MRAFVAVGLAVLGAGAAPVHAHEAPRAVYALLADNTLVRTDAALRTWTAVRIGATPRRVISVGELLARSRDGRRLWAVDRSGGRLVALTPSLRFVRAVTLPRPWQARAIAVGPRSGRLYLAYNVAFPVRGRSDPPRSAHLAVFTADGRLLENVLLRPHGRRSWLLWWLALSADERHAYVTYHGSDTTGLDALALHGLRIDRCPAGATRFAGCWGGPHGLVATLGDEVVTTTGEPTVNVYDARGALLRQLDTGLIGNHLMGFALDPSQRRLFAAGSCGYVPGFAVVDLATGERRLLTHRHSACGDTIAYAGGDAVVVGKTALPVPDPERQGVLLVVDAATGAIAHAHATRADPIAVAAYG